MVLEPDEDEVLEASQIGMVLEPEARRENALNELGKKVEARVRRQTPKRNDAVRRDTERVVQEHAEFDAAPQVAAPNVAPQPVAAEESRKNWYGVSRAERRWDLVETVETAPARDPGPAPRRVTPRKNPYRAPESQWDARIEEIIRPARPRVAMWTAISAGVSAIICCIAFVLAAPEDPAPTDVAASDPIVIRYDEDLLAPSNEIATASVTDDHVGDRRSHALALALRGRTNMLAGRTKLALSQFNEALEHNAQNRLALAQLGEHHLARGRAAKAAEYLRRAVRVEPRDAKAQFLLGRAYEQLGRPQKAEQHYRAAHELGHAEAAGELGK